jgi:hypothetical protein
MAVSSNSGSSWVYTGCIGVARADKIVGAATAFVLATATAAKRNVNRG